MTLGDAVGLSDSQERRITRGLQLVLGGVVLAGLVTTQVGMAVTGSLTLGVTLFPALLRREYGYSMDPGLVLWITIAMILHTIGSLGVYEQYQWYDEVTHTASATIIAGVGYASFRALERHSDAIDVPSEFRAVFIVVFVLATGVFWEVIEYVLGGYVTVYGIDDIVTDFVFNAVGAVIVAVWGTGYVRNLTGFFYDRLR
ncbi:hypothetical protein ACFR9U_21070 [Halorientalis brevis]|uniref:Uncharacterized protein n=1 Tax=Halorientalis brevis TaxID=1126241 RepID=A0ABD6CHE1_9EURY|nr:hypothetical protein [Halorientalis brevis]